MSANPGLFTCLFPVNEYDWISDICPFNFRDLITEFESLHELSPVYLIQLSGFHKMSGMVKALNIESEDLRWHETLAQKR